MSKAGYYPHACDYYSSLWLVVWVMRGMVRSFCCHNWCTPPMLQPKAACSACIAAFACNVHIWTRRCIYCRTHAASSNSLEASKTTDVPCVLLQFADHSAEMQVQTLSYLQQGTYENSFVGQQRKLRVCQAGVCQAGTRFVVWLRSALTGHGQCSCTCRWSLHVLTVQHCTQSRSPKSAAGAAALKDVATPTVTSPFVLHPRWKLVVLSKLGLRVCQACTDRTD